MRSRDRSLLVGFLEPIEETGRWPLCWPCENAVGQGPFGMGGEPSSGPEPVGTLILDADFSRTMRNRRLLLQCPVCCAYSSSLTSGDSMFANIFLGGGQPASGPPWLIESHSTLPLLLRGILPVCQCHCGSQATRSEFDYTGEA